MRRAGRRAGSPGSEVESRQEPWRFAVLVCLGVGCFCVCSDASAEPVVVQFDMVTRFLGEPEPPPREDRVTLAYDTDAPNDLEAVEEQNEFGLPVFAAYEMRIQWDTGEDFISTLMYFADHPGVRSISLMHASPSFYDFMLNPGTTITTPPARLFDYVQLDEFEGEEVYMLWGNFPMLIDPDSVVYIPEPAGLPLILAGGLLAVLATRGFS